MLRAEDRVQVVTTPCPADPRWDNHPLCREILWCHGPLLSPSKKPFEETIFKIRIGCALKAWIVEMLLFIFTLNW